MATSSYTEYTALREGLLSLTGADFDTAEHHPGLLIDQITDDDTIVYVWYPAAHDTPCVAWNSPRGWSAALVDSDDLGWSNDLWFSRTASLSEAVLDAPDATTLTALLAIACDRASNFLYGDDTRAKYKGLAWGLLRLLDPTEHTKGLTIADDYDLNLTGAGVRDDNDRNPGVAVGRDDLLASRAM